MKRVELDGDVLVFRVKVRGIYRDRIYVRDRRELRGNNVWRRIAHYRALRELEGMGCPPAREGAGVKPMAAEQLYEYAWGNNPKRAGMRGRVCRVVCRGRLNSCLAEFVDNGQREVISRNALRKRRDGEALKGMGER